MSDAKFNWVSIEGVKFHSREHNIRLHSFGVIISQKPNPATEALFPWHTVDCVSMILPRPNKEEPINYETTKRALLAAQNDPGHDVPTQMDAE